MNRLRSLLRDERGIALPVALAVLFVTAGLATVAAREAITAGHQSFRDENAKRAFWAAFRTDFREISERSPRLRSPSPSWMSSARCVAPETS